MKAKTPQHDPARASDLWTRQMDAVKAHRDQNAFGQIFDYFAPRLKSHLLGAGVGAEMAEEIVQETMITVWRKADQFDPKKAAFSSWLYTICRNKKIDRLRRESKPAPDLTDPAVAPPEPARADELLSEIEDANALYDALAALPDEQREPILLSFMSSKPHPEVAKLLNLPVGTVKSRIRLGVSKLRAYLSNKDLE